MSYQSLCRQYANALIGAMSKEEISTLVENGEKIKEFFGNAVFQEVIKNPFLDMQKKLDFFKEIFAFSQEKIQKMLVILAQANRLNLLVGIIGEIENILMQEKQTYRAVLFTKQPADCNELASFRERLTQKIGCNLEFEEKSWNQEGIKCYVEGLDLEVSFSGEAFIQQLENFILDTFKKGV